MILIYIMYSTRAIAKKEQNGKYEIIRIQRGRTSENDIDIDIKFCGFSPFADLHLANYDWGSVPGKNLNSLCYNFTKFFMLQNFREVLTS